MTTTTTTGTATGTTTTPLELKLRDLTPHVTPVVETVPRDWHTTRRRRRAQEESTRTRRLGTLPAVTGSGKFTIDVVYTTTPPTGLTAVFDYVVAKWGKLLTTKHAPIQNAGTTSVCGTRRTLPPTINDMLVYVLSLIHI